MRPRSRRTEAGRRKSHADTRTTGRERTRNGSTSASASTSGRAGGAPSTSTRTRPGPARSIAATSSSVRASGVSGRIGIRPRIPAAPQVAVRSERAASGSASSPAWSSDAKSASSASGGRGCIISSAAIEITAQMMM